MTSNTRDVVRATERLVSRQVPFALSRALTETARDIERNTLKRIERVFDRPTPFTRRSVFVRPARRSRLVALVGIKDRQASYLMLQETGGARRPKGRALVLPVQARVNQYGNLPRQSVARALARPDTFSGRVKGIGGVWQRRGPGKVRLLVAYEPTADYDARLGFRDGARKTGEARFREHLRRSMAHAIRTARR